MKYLKQHYHTDIENMFIHPEVALTSIVAQDSHGLYCRIYIGECERIPARYLVDGMELSESEERHVKAKYWHEIRAALRGYKARKGGQCA